MRKCASAKSIGNKICENITPVHAFGGLLNGFLGIKDVRQAFYNHYVWLYKFKCIILKGKKVNV